MQEKEVFETPQEIQDGVVDVEASSPVIMLRSELAQEIISRRAGFAEHWALPIFLIILLVIFGGSWFVHYPDSVATRATIIAENVPMRVSASKEGILTNLLVNDGQEVKRNDIIGWLESTANHTQVLTLMAQVNNATTLLNSNDVTAASKAIDHNFNNLGELQQAYEQILISGYQSKAAFHQQLLALKYRLTEWLKRYTLTAPVDGKISFSSPVHTGRHLSAGSLIGFVVPQNVVFYAEAMVPQNSFGKIDTGLNVQLKLDAYPYQDWGMVRGKISHISSVLAPGGFLVTIEIDPSLITSDNKKIELRNGLNAEALIITKDVRLFQKFYHGFISSTSLDKK